MENPWLQDEGPTWRRDERRTVLSVSELTTSLRETVEQAYDDVWVEGELSNFKRPSSGHCYFTLKDAEAQLRCVMWRSTANRIFFQPRDGLLVRIRASASVYERRGDLQLIARSMQMAGEGALQKAFEALKRKLDAEGVFAAEHKQPLPPFPEKIGVITSGTGAAIHDILSILERRFPQITALVCPVQVQGIGAAEQVAEAIEAFNEAPLGDAFRVDVLIVGRGGGSAEDLWAFNEEVVARAIFASSIPIISAVGHESDISIADFVADVRAATPSMAAELAVPDQREVRMVVDGLARALNDYLERYTEAAQRRVEVLVGSYHFNRVQDRILQERQHIDALEGRLERRIAQHLDRIEDRRAALQQRLHLLDPQRPLRLGYVQVTQAGEPVTTSKALAAGDRVVLQFRDGKREADIAS